MIQINSRNSILIAAIAILFTSCAGPKEEVDTILINGKVVIVDSAFNVSEAIALRDGKVLKTGSSDDILGRYTAKDIYDLHGASVYPGFIDAHCHFYAYGIDLQELNLKSAISFDDMIQKTVEYAQEHNPNYIVGRGWNEEEWESKSTVNKFKLDILFPETPVVLQRVDGHAALCNQAALDLAGIDENSEFEGGMVEKVGGYITGMLIDKATEPVFNALPEPTTDQKIKSLIDAQKICFSKGLTTVSDAGLPLATLELMDSLHRIGDLNIRIYAMSNPDLEELKQLYDTGIRADEHLIFRSVKLYFDGSLGSRGALLKQPYCDKPEHYGLMQHDLNFYREIMDYCNRHNLQVNTHCIGDSANFVMLTEYGNYLGGTNDKRWRIEHAQVVDPSDYHLFRDYSVIPSVQPTHATSDMYMAQERLCSEDRLEGAYSYKSLLAQNDLIAFGTDFPVEAIDPIGTYLASVDRKGKKGEKFRPEEGLPYRESIKAMTIWAAYSNFMDSFTGSLESGKVADLVIVSKNLEYVSNPDEVTVQGTMVDGKFVYLKGLKRLEE